MMFYMAFVRLYEIIQGFDSNLIDIFTALTPFLFMSFRMHKNSNKFSPDPPKIGSI